MATPGGNLLMYDEHGATMCPKAQLRETVVFKDDDALIISHIFMDKLELISSMDNVSVTRSPKDTDPIEELTFEYDQGSNVHDEISRLIEDIRNIEKEEVVVPGDKLKEAETFLKSSANRSDILLVSELSTRKIKVYGKDCETIRKVAHQLKVKVGLIKITKRHHGTGQVLDNSEILRQNNTNSGASRSGRSDNETFYFEADVNDYFTLKVYKESITRVKVDVIVNAANENMMHGGGVARVISEAAGYELDQESREYIEKNGSLHASDNIVTNAGRLKYKCVIHAVGPTWYDYRENKIECLETLYVCIWNILERCEEKHFRTVAMSAISSGIFGVPKELCADMYIAAAIDFASKKEKSEGLITCPDELHIIDIDVNILQLVKSSFEKWKKNPKSVQPKESFERYIKDNPYYQRGYSNVGNEGLSRSRRQRPANQGHHTVVAMDTTNETGKVVCKSAVKKLQSETFRWGATAQLYLVGKDITVKIFKADIHKSTNLDAVVCGIDKSLQARGYIADALKNAGGREYRCKFQKMVDSHKRGFVKQSDVYKCKAGKLSVDHVMFSVSERIVYASEKETETYEEAILSVLEKANVWKFKKLAIPLYGTGQIATNKDKLRKCAIAVLKALDTFVDMGDNKWIQEIHLVNSQDLVNDVLIEVFNGASSVKDDHRQSRNPHARQSSGSRSLHTDYNSGKTGQKSDSELDHRNSSTGDMSTSRRTYSADGHEDFESGDKSSGKNKQSILRSSQYTSQSGLSNKLEDDDNVVSPAASSTVQRKGNLAIFYD